MTTVTTKHASNVPLQLMMNFRSNHLMKTDQFSVSELSLRQICGRKIIKAVFCIIHSDSAKQRNCKDAFGDFT